MLVSVVAPSLLVGAFCFVVVACRYCCSMLFVGTFYRNGQLLGKGGFGTVRVVTHKETQMKYALKVRLGTVWCGTVCESQTKYALKVWYGLMRFGVR